MNKIISLEEHSECNLSQELLDRFQLDKQFVETDDKYPVPLCLGINKKLNCITADYYIGTEWLIKSEVAAVVEPKISNIDFMSLFAAALSLETEHEVEYFSHYYGINFNEPEIEVNSTVVDCLTPLLITHYLALLNILTQKGLKKGYLYREENLHSKIKGKILFQKNLRKNQLSKREDRIYCGFNEYTNDIPENRLLKKALIFSDKALKNCLSLRQNSQNELYKSLKRNINKLKPYFENISDNIQIKDVQNVSTNKLYKGYKETITVAKAILRKFDYSFSNINENSQKTYPFWIDMPRLYEMFVYSKLKEKYKNEVEFQVEGYGRGDYKTAADFILKKQGIILDAKYKPRYEYTNAGVISDIREISGYARDEKILSHFDESQKENIPCVILYPSNYSEMDEVEDEESDLREGLLSSATKIKAFRDFYKIKVELPRI